MQLEEQARTGEIGFMERFKIVWDECYSEFRHLTIQCRRDNAGRFIKDKPITNLILVGNREQVAEQLIEVPDDINNEEIEENYNRLGRENQDIMEENEQTSQE